MSRKIEKLAIANRGEVAVRIIRACQELGIETVLLHSEADVGSFAYRLADQRMLIGGTQTADSYLNVANNINGAVAVGADAIHPGFGFLSENSHFAEQCEEHRLMFVGPSAESIKLFGDKISAKKLAQSIGAPIIPGYSDEDQSDERLMKEIEAIGLPVMVKASGGGGGRGLRVIREMREAPGVIESARREALSAFGSDKLFIEKYLERAKHIEVQVFGDATGKIHALFDRECTVQRRHQKIIEEAQAWQLDESIRKKIIKTAVGIAEAAEYKNAGTVEFLYQDGEFFFMEMNTRLQVEHPVTELVAGVDLVKAQIMTTQGQGVLWDSHSLIPKGHAIECRLYAEDPYNNGIPSTGTIRELYLPYGPGRRFDMGIERGDTVSSHYDSMIGKVIVWDESRYRAIRKMCATLKDLIIFGVRTNIPMLIAMLNHTEFVEGTMTTRFVEEHFSKPLKKNQDEETFDRIVKAVLEHNIPGGQDSTGPQRPNPWLVGDNR